MGRVRKSLKVRYWRKVITYFLTCCLFLNTSLPAVMAGPTGGVVDTNPINGGGVAAITYGTGLNNNTTQVDVSTTRTIINWESLDTVGGDINNRETLAFLQGGLTDSAVLNRVSGAATQFYGDLSAPGMSIFVVNPAGVVFGTGSTVNVTQLVASGLNMQNDAFNNYLDDPVNNKMEFTGGDGIVSNRAVINANSVYLIGKKVFNVGPIIAPDGLVVMAAGDEVRLYENGSDVSVVVSDIGYSLDVRNSNIVSVNNGKIVLAAGDTYSRAISNVGILAASSGEVELKAASVENRGWIYANASTSGGDGGSISLIGTDEVVIGEDKLGNDSETTANGGATGNGGTITIKAGTDTVEGTVTIEETSLVMANGGSISGAGGTVSITCDDFEIAGDILASPGNKINEPGKLEINAPNVIIADGANAGVTNTIYEDDIEALSQSGTSLIVNAEEGITVKDITDGIGGADPGVINGRFGNIELHATGVDSAVTFADSTDTIRTTLGDIVIEAGSGGIDVGNLITGKDLSNEKPLPGQIELTTHNGGDITTGDLIIEDGWGHAEINVDSAGDLTVNGDVIVGGVAGEYGSPILTVPNESAAEAVIYLEADNNVVLNGLVQARAYGTEEDDESITKAYIDVIAGKNQNTTGDVTLYGDLVAEAKASSNGTADAVIKVDAWGDITFVGDAEAYAMADNGAAEAGPGTVDDEDTSTDGDHAQIIINPQGYPTPGPIANDNEKTISKNEVKFEIDVLADDTQGGEPLVPQGGSVQPGTYTKPVGILTENVVDEKILSFNYTPPTDAVYVDNGDTDEGGAYAVYTDSFQYYAQDATGELISQFPATVTITVKNYIPVASIDLKSTVRNQPVNIDVILNDTDLDGDLLTAVLVGDFKTTHGMLVLNDDGTFTYTPDEGYIGQDKFKYTATDGYNTSSGVDVTITVNEQPPAPPAPLSIPATPGLDSLKIEVQTSGCPALVKWAAEEIGIDQRMVQIWINNSLASTGDIQPCNACSELKNSAQILQDADGSHIAALAQVIDEFASSDTPPTEEQMASIADAIARNTSENSYYAVAGEYLDALASYVGVLNNEMGFSAVESVQFVTDKYVGRLAQGGNVGVATFIAANLAALGE